MMEGSKFTKFRSTFKLQAILASNDASKLSHFFQEHQTFKNKFTTGFNKTVSADEYDLEL